MGNCGSALNCTQNGQPVEADPDIAGIGVLISFIATATITFVAIVIGYLFDSVPDDLLTDFDRACVAKLSLWWHRHRQKRRAVDLTVLNYAVMIASVGFGNIASKHSSPNTAARDKAARLQRSRILERFILTLSDQQLITGLGILIAGFKGLCTISFYNFNIITAVAWFSSTTHLSTLAILRGYLIDHPRIRNWRAAAILCLFVLLMVAQLAIAAPADFSVSAQCLFYSWAYWQSFRPLTVGPFGGTIIIVLFLVASYTDRIVRLYSFDPEWTIQVWLARVVFRQKNQFLAVEQMAIAAHAGSHAAIGAAFRRIRYQRRLAVYMERQETERNLLRYRVRELMFINQEIQHSFIGELQALLFGVSFGITQIILFRGLVSTEPIPDTDQLIGDQNTLGFGQLVPLLLILLPIFAAGEAYDEHRDASATPPLIMEDHPTRLEYKDFWRANHTLTDTMHGTLDQSRNTNDLPSYKMGRGFRQQTGVIDTETANEAAQRKSSPSHEAKNLADLMFKTLIKPLSPWRSVAIIIMGRMTLMALYGITFAGAFNLINNGVGLGAIALAAFLWGLMTFLEFLYMLRSSRRLQWRASA